MIKLYMAVTADKYELPIAVCSNIHDLARIFGIKPQSVSESISRKRPGKKTGVKFIRIEVDENDKR